MNADRPCATSRSAFDRKDHHGFRNSAETGLQFGICECLFEEKWRAGKRLREGYVNELRLLRELVMMDSLLIRKEGRLRVGATGRHVLRGARERVQRNFFRNCFWEVSLSLFGEPECGNWPQPQIGQALWSLSTTGGRIPKA